MTTLTATSVAIPDVKGRNGSNRGTAEKIVFALGCAKVGMGLGEMLAPRTFSRWTGRRHWPVVTRAKGLRKVATGVGILTQARSSANRTQVGSMLSLGALLAGTISRPKYKRPSGTALAAIAGVTAAGIVIARQLRASRTVHERSLRLTASTMINRPPHECYDYWHDIERFPEFFREVKSVRVTGDRRSHWIANGPGGKEISWDSEVTQDLPGEAIEWRSLNGTPIPHSGSVRFEPVREGRCTIVRLRMVYEMPVSAARSAISSTLGPDPGFRLRKDLRRFKSMMETGEIATAEGQPAGRKSGATQLDRLARV